MNDFGIGPTDKIAAFIDGANFYATGKGLGLDIDYLALRKLLDKDHNLVRIYYYTAVNTTSDGQGGDEFISIKPLLDFLDYNGFEVVTKPTKTFTDATGQRKIKGNLDVEMTCDMLEIADRVDHIVMFTGDGDFVRAVRAVQRKAVKVTVCSSLQTSPPMISDDLRRAADQFVDVAKFSDKITRKSPAGGGDRAGVDRVVRAPVAAGIRPNAARAAAR